MSFAWGLAVLMTMLAMPAAADIDESAYQAGGSVRSEREWARLQLEFAAQRAAEHEQARQSLAAAEHAAAAARARDAARPYAERLTEQRCTVCHAAGNYSAKRHTWLYWRLVVARMAWINDAPVTAAEQGVIASHLAVAYPARLDERAIEYGLPLLAAGLLAGTTWIGRRLWRRHLARAEGENDESGQGLPGRRA